MQNLEVTTSGSQQPYPSFWTRVAAGIDSISVFAGSAAGYLMFLVAIFTTYDVMMRWLFNAPTLWSYEICQYSLVWFGFLSAAFCLKERRHVYVDIFVSRLQPRTAVPMKVLSYLVCSGYAGLIFIYSVKMALGAYTTHEMSPTMLRIPIYLVGLGIVIGSLLLCLQAMRILVEKVAVLLKGQLQGGPGLINKPAFLIPLYIILLSVSIWIYSILPAAGIVTTIILLLLSGTHIFVAIGTVGILGIFLLMGAQTGLPQLGFIALKALDNYALLAIPLYVMAGEIILRGGMGQEMFEFGYKMIGHWRGGLAGVVVLTCAIFGAPAGSSVATAAVVSVIALPETIKRGYNPRVIYGALAAGGTLGIMLPPSNSMILYSAITDESTGALFIAGIIPGIVLSVVFAVFAMYMARRAGGYVETPAAPWKERILTIKKTFWGAIATPILFILPIYLGICTASEAAGLSVLYCLILCLVRRKIKLRDLPHVFAETTRSSTMILMIIVGALVLGINITTLQFTQELLNYVQSLHMPVWVVMLIISILYLVLGMFLEVVSIIYITMPIVYPLIISMGLDGIWFGIYSTLLFESALIMPPIGLNLWVITGLARTSISEVVRGASPYIVLLLLSLLLLWFFPELATWLPSVAGPR